MKFPWVSRKEYDKIKGQLNYANEVIDSYLNNMKKEEYEWLVKLFPEDEDCESEYITVSATHFKVEQWGSWLYVMNGNELVGKFRNVEYYVRIDKADW